MKPFVDNILRHLKQAPMLCALCPLIVGIVVAEWTGIGAGYAAVALLLLILLTLWRGGNGWLMGAIIAAGALSVALRSTPALPSQGEMEIEVGRIVREDAEVSIAEARIVAYMADGKIYRSRADVRLHASGVAIEQGDRLRAIASIRRYTDENDYSRYMAAQGIVAQVFISHENILLHSHSEPSLIARLQHYALQRIQDLHLTPDAERLTRTAGIGDRSSLSSDMRRAYTLSGGAHLLSVSGLHVGFICIVLNVLFALLTLLRGGQVVRSVLVVGAIWLYAAMAGFSPSVVRAATMFSIVQIATTLYASARGLNTLAFTAFVMLTVDARTIHDAGFLLSFLSVAAILVWVAPYARARRRLLPSHSLWRDVAQRTAFRLLMAIEVSIAATAMTLPLASSLFGTITLWGILLSPILVPLCGVLVGVTILWVVLPIAPLQTLVGWILEHTATTMNSLSEWAAQSGYLTAEVGISQGWSYAIYGVFLLLTLVLWALPAPREKIVFDFAVRNEPQGE